MKRSRYSALWSLRWGSSNQSRERNRRAGRPLSEAMMNLSLWQAGRRETIPEPGYVLVGVDSGPIVVRLDRCPYFADLDPPGHSLRAIVTGTATGEGRRPEVTVFHLPPEVLRGNSPGPDRTPAL